jgi:hypothetical protein
MNCRGSRGDDFHAGRETEFAAYLAPPTQYFLTAAAERLFLHPNLWTISKTN